MDAPRVNYGSRVWTRLDRFAVGARGLLLAAAVVSIPLATGRATIADETATPAEVVDGVLDAGGDNGWLNEQLLLARAHISKNDHEQALPLLAAVIEKHSGHSLRVGEALLLRGICELQGLQRRKAGASFSEFLERYPDAPPRMLATARQNLLLLEGLELGSLDDIHSQIEYSRRRLSLEDSGAKTQNVQDDVVAMLTSMIEEIEKKGGT